MANVPLVGNFCCYCKSVEPRRDRSDRRATRGGDKFQIGLEQEQERERATRGSYIRPLFSSGTVSARSLGRELVEFLCALEEEDSSPI